MPKRLYVGNLPKSMTSSDLEAMFSEHGEVRSADVITDRDLGQSRGFGFVEMQSDQAADAAIAALNGTNVEGRTLVVNEARERPKRGGGGGGGGRRPPGGGSYRSGRRP
jgi:RNA recognition motif-containing protein